MIDINMIAFRAERKVIEMAKGYLILIGITIILTAMDYILIGLKYAAIAMVIIASIIVMLYILSIRYGQRNFIGTLSSAIIYYIFTTKVTRAKDMLKNNEDHYAVCEEIILLLKNFRFNDAKYLYRKELQQTRLRLEKFKLDFDEEDEVIEPFKDWYSQAENHFLQDFNKEDTLKLNESDYDNLN